MKKTVKELSKRAAAEADKIVKMSVHDRLALLRVARAAYTYDYCNDDDLERKKRLLLEMRNALWDAEHLLG